jgi:predicted flap endonuclease-1-like 5' DNA nuclease
LSDLVQTKDKEAIMFEQQVNLGPGTGTFTQHSFEILVMLLGAFLLGVWLGWMLWNRYKQEADKLRLDIQSLTATANTLTTEANILKTKFAASEKSNVDLRAEADQLEESNRLLQEQFAKTSEELAKVEERNRQLETELGLSFGAETPTPEAIPLEINIMPDVPVEIVPPPPPIEMPDIVVVIDTPTTEIIIEAAPPLPEEKQPEQPVAEPATEKTPPPVVVAPVPAGDAKDDLTVIEGIGPKIQELLHQYGISTYNQLADTEVTRLKEILAEAGPQLAMHDPGTWPSQANLAANDQWEALKSIQGFLKGGKKPT